MPHSIPDTALDSYDYATDPILKEKWHSWDRVYIDAMMSYESQISKFGLQMMAHQNRTSKLGADFLRFLDFSDQAAKNFRAAMLFHDIGKTHSTYNPAIWSLAERPTPAERAVKRKHAKLGGEMMETFARERGLLSHPHFKVRHAVTRYHHERADNQGPDQLGAAYLPVFVQVSCLVDAYDGDRIKRPHQPRQRTHREAIRRMMSMDGHDKYLGAFHTPLLNKFAKFLQQKYEFTL